MTAHANISAAGLGSSAFVPALEIRDTQWGFVVTESGHGLSHDLLAEAAMKFAAVAALIAAAAQWLMPGSMFSGDVLAMKLVLTAALAGLAGVLFRFADRGTVTELQVDAALREIRVGDRTLRGASRIRNRIPMREIAEVFVRPDSTEPGQTELCFRVTDHADPIRIASATVSELAPVLERLTRDLRTPRERVELRLAS
jgi:hypothetical protein